MVNTKHKLATIIMATSFVFMSWVSYVMLYPYKLIEFNTPKYEILTPKVKRGGVVLFNIDLIKNTDLPCMRSRQLINGYSYAITPKIVNALKGKVNIVASQQLPDFIEPGTYHIRTTYQYNINQLRTLVYVIDTEDFEVIE